MNLPDARAFLGMMPAFPGMGVLRQNYLEAIDVLGQSDLLADRQLAQARRTTLPRNAWRFARPVLVPLNDRHVHRIWVTGDPAGNMELHKSVLSQPRIRGWTNLLWCYDDAMARRRVPLNGHTLVCGPTLSLLGTPLVRVCFRDTMRAWADRPGWIDDVVRYLDAMLPKRGYVAMGDLMRMVILWFAGGVYVDVKILFDVATAPVFFRRPRVPRDRLVCVDAGHGMENWAMMSHARCDMVREIMWRTLYRRLPPIRKIRQMPVNGSHPSGRYSRAHKELHEDKGVWPVMQTRYAEQIVRFGELQPRLQLRNPRPHNSWADDDGVAFDWG